MVTLDDIETLFKSNYGRMHSLASAMLHDREDKNRHADFSITVTYTLNYGKKLRDVENLSTRDASSSGILKN